MVAFRFGASDTGGDWTEVCAYGTAAVVTPVSDGVDAESDYWMSTVVALLNKRPGIGAFVDV